MATFSFTSDDGELDSASAVVEVHATNPEYNQPALRVRQEGTGGGAASIRIDDPNPDIELVETGLSNPAVGAGKFEIAVQADRLQINGRERYGAQVRHHYGVPAACGRWKYGVRIDRSQGLRQVR